MASDPFADDLSANMGGWDADPASWNKIIQAAHQKYPNVSPQMLHGILQTESSGWKNDADSSAGSQGPMGFMPKTAASVAPGGINPYHPGEAIPAAAKIISERLQANGGDPIEALRFYEGGHLQGGPVNTAYPAKVLAAGQGYKPPPPSDPFMDDLVGALNPPPPAQAPGATLPDAGVAPAQGGGTAASPVPAPVAASGAPSVPSAPPAGSVPPAQAIPAQAGAPPQAPSGPPQPSWPWDATDEWANAGTLGVYPRLMAGAGALGGLAYGQPVGQSYNAIRDAQLAGQKDWEAHNSLGGVIANTVGPIPATLSGLGVAGAGVRMAGGAVARALPAIADTLGGLYNATGLAGRVAASVGTGAVQGAGAGALDSLLNPGSVGDQAEEGAKVGAVLGPFAPLVSKAITPVINPAIAGLSRAADALGVRLPVSSMVNGTKNVAAAGSPAGTEELQQYSQALAKQMGVNADTLTPAGVKAARDSLGNGLDTAYAQVHVPSGDVGLAGDLNSILTRADSSLASNHKAKGQILKAGQAILDGITDPNGINGKVYQSLTSDGGPIKALVNSSDSSAQFYGKAFQKALWDAGDRNAPAQAANTPGLMDQISSLKTKYAIASKLSDAANVAGDTGIINPSTVKTQFKDWGKNSPYGADMNTLAQIAPLLPKPNALGNAKAPGAVTRAISQLARPELLGGLLGAGAQGAISGNALEAGLAGAGTAGLTALGHAGLRSVANANWYRNMLVDLALGGSGGTAGQVARALPVAPIVAGTNLMNQTGR